jgi:UDP-2,4-diacetamido-2,4,6-trideoxy-beta-L-altropyranose hydrolase
VIKTLFRADSSSSIGLGHIKRDLVYATRLKEADISFASVDNCIEIPYPTHKLQTQGIEELIDLCQKEQIQHLIIDNYQITYEDEKKLKDTLDIKLSVFDDTYKRHYCDEILNHNISADRQKYTLEPFTEVSIISALIRDEFKRLPQRNREEKTQEIMIAMGGVDSQNLTPKIIPLCQGFKKIHVITSAVNQHLDELKKIPNITLHIDTDKMAEIMNQCDLAIITPSVIVHEALYMHLPFIAIKTAENQNDIYNYLKENSYEVLASFQEEKLSKLIEKEILSYPFLRFAIRKTMEEDLMNLFTLANDPLVRSASLSSSPIELETHKEWFRSSMQDPLLLLFTILDGRAKFLGQLRFDLRQEGEAIISISLVSSSRGFSLSEKIIRQGTRIIHKLHPNRTLLAQIKPDNIASIKSFEKAGFTCSNKKDDILYYTLGASDD